MSALMVGTPQQRATQWLALAPLPMLVFLMRGPTQFRWVIMPTTGALILVAAGIVAFVGARLARRPLVIGAGVICAVAFVVQLAQFGRDTRWLGGGGSMIALYLAFALGYLTLGLIRPEPNAD